MKKLDYKSMKLLALMQVLNDYDYKYVKEKDSIEVTFDRAPNSLIRILKRVNAEYKTPTLTYQITESDSVISVYNPSI